MTIKDIAKIRREKNCSLVEAKAIALGLTVEQLSAQQEAIIEPLEKVLNGDQRD